MNYIINVSFLYRVFRKFVTKIFQIPYYIISNKRGIQKDYLTRRYLLCVAVMMKFFGSLFFSYFFSAGVVATDVAEIINPFTL